jgi:hypothetical protein
MRFILPPASSGIRRYQITRATVVGRGIMLAGIAWEVEGTKSRVLECFIVWFAMFTFHDVFVDLLEVAS